MRVLSAALLAGALAGCGAMVPGRTRPAEMEFESEQGTWRTELRAAELELDGWSLRVAEATVNAVSEVPRLETLVLEITNASQNGPLVLEPMEIYLHGIGRDITPLGPGETMVLAGGETVVMCYDPGVRAPLLAYPFVVDVTVFRGPGYSDPRRVTFTLY